MALIASDLIEEARDFHRDFVQEVFPNRMLLRALSRAQEDLYRAAVVIDDEPLAITQAIVVDDAITALTNGTALTLPDFITINSIEATADDGSVYTIRLVSDREVLVDGELVAELIGTSVRLRLWNRAPTAAEAADVFDEIASLRMTYVPLPDRLTTMDDELIVPPSARSYLVASLVAFMASRIELAEANKLLQRATDLQASVVQSLTDMAHTPWTVRVV